MRFLPLAVLAGAAMIAAALIYTQRYDIAAPAAGGGGHVAYRLDRISGEVAVCTIDVHRSVARGAVFLKCHDEVLPTVDSLLGSSKDIPPPPPGYTIINP